MSMPPPLIVIFGAAVRPDGEPSAALIRRIGYGLAAASRHPNAPILCSGGSPRFGPTEASVMAQALTRAGVASERLILDEASLNTLQNVQAAVRQMREGGHPHLVICSDAYHVPRVRLKLALHGVRSKTGPAPRGPGRESIAHWLAMSLREALAIPYYLVVLLAQGLRRSS